MKKRIENQIIKADTYSKLRLKNEDNESLLNEVEKDAVNSIYDGVYEVWREKTILNYDKKKDLELLKNKIEGINKKGISKLLVISRSIAAVFIFAILMGSFYYMFRDVETCKPKLVQPGKSIAYLEINGKKQIELTHPDTLLLFDKTKAKLCSSKMTYSAETKNSLKNEYHNISVPRNGEFFIQLSDSTKVWLNSESKIGFYSRFEDNRRIVDLEGEAYFEVAKDEKRPFIVRTKNMHIQALGTHFNVKAYKDEIHTYATLCEGKIKVKISNKYVLIKPNHQVVLNNGNGKYETKEVEASLYSSWTKGMFIFKDEPLKNIMQSLSRWYDVDVFYVNQSIKDELYSMSINRYDDIETILNKLEKTGTLHFKLNSKTLIVCK